MIPATAMAFPIADPTTPSVVTEPPSELAAPDVRDLQHHMGLLSGLGAASAGGWSFFPSLNIAEVFNDNVLQVQNGRRWDFTTIVQPNFAVVGDTPRIQTRFNYSPELELYARTGSQNALNQNFGGTAEITGIPDLFYIDLRGMAGVTTANGLGGIGGLGNTTGTTTITPSTLGTISGNTQGLSKANRTQVVSFSASPYLMHRFGDIGTAKVGVSAGVTAQAVSPNGFLPFLSSDGTTSKQTFLEEIAQFQTGERFEPWRNLTILDAYQQKGSGSAGLDSTQQSLSDQLGYAVSRKITVFGRLGYENIRYSGATTYSVRDMIWGLGTTLTPNPDASLTVEYGHQQGQNGASLSAHYALTARTSIGARYTTGLATSLGQVQNELNLADLDNNGALVDRQTGAPLFGANNALGQNPGLFNYKTFSTDITTASDRDTIALTMIVTKQSAVGFSRLSPSTFTVGSLTTPGSSNSAVSLILSWVRSLTPDLGFSASVAGSHVNNNGVVSASTWNTNANLGLQYALSQTVALTFRYSFYDSSSNQPGRSIYQNLVIVGLSKQF